MLQLHAVYYHFDLAFFRLSIAIPLSGMYGYDLETLQDPCVVAAEKSASIGVNLLMPGANFVNAFPILGRIPAWVPGAQSVRIAAEVKGYTEEMKRIPTDHAKKRMVRAIVVSRTTLYNF